MNSVLSIQSHLFFILTFNDILFLTLFLNKKIKRKQIQEEILV